jgi:hypothetical protein
MTEHVEVAVIDGGQAGLARSYSLTHIRGFRRTARALAGGLS